MGISAVSHTKSPRPALAALPSNEHRIPVVYKKRRRAPKFIHYTLRQRHHQRRDDEQEGDVR